MKDNLIAIIDYILNKATEKEIVAIKAALDRRIKGKLATGKSLSDMVTGMTATVKDRMQAPLEQIRSSVKGMVVRLIKENAPDITDDQLKILLDEWMPDSRKRISQRRSRAQSGGLQSGRLPPDAVKSMIMQFVDFSIGRMPAEMDTTLRKEMPDWPGKYWNSFPEEVRALISTFLRGNMDEESFEDGINDELGL